MSRRFYPLSVAKVVNETSEAFSIFFENPGIEEFHYKPGQYLILETTIEGKPFRRAFSLSTSPFLDKELAVTIKCIENGKVSNYLHKNLNAGNKINVMPPQGNFTIEPDPELKRHYVLFGGGSGITPLFSILRSVLHKEPKSTVTLLYANRDENSIIFREKLKELENLHDNFKLIHSLDQPPEKWNGLSGMLNPEKVSHFLENEAQTDVNDQALYFICGPAGMMEMIKKTLKNKGVDDQSILQEHFTASLPEIDKKTAATMPAETNNGGSNKRPEKAKVTVILDGETHQIEVGPKETILEAAIDAGIDPPFACQEGICTTCQAKLHKGRVHMDEDEGLTDEEIEEGYVLTCQSHPLTDEVKVEYE
jgi:ring-1,2-phenylacetyl-CoA epoxidase subunit PaaE